MSSNLTNEQRDLLIDLIKKRRIIYDTNDPNYKNITYKRRVWRDVATFCKAQESACKIVWKSMRDQYQRYMRTPINKRKKCRYLSKLSFLEGFTKNTKKQLVCGNDNETDFSVENSLCSSNHHIPFKEEYEDYQSYNELSTKKISIEYRDKNNESENEEITSEPIKIFRTSHSKDVPIYSNDYFTQNSNSEDITEDYKINRSANELCDTVTKLLEKYFQCDEDENDLFIKMIGKKMKYLPLEAKNRLQQLILKEVNDEIGKLNKKTRK